MNAAYRHTKRTTSDLVATVLTAMGRDMVARSTIRRHLANVGVEPSSTNLRHAIAGLERFGYVRRKDDRVETLDHQGLHAWLNRDVPTPEYVTRQIADITRNCLDQKSRQESVVRGDFPDGPGRRGISDLVALALVTLDLDTVRRSTIRALCPQQPAPMTDGRIPKQTISTAINRACRRFELKGWISRDDAFVRVHDRDALRSWIEQGIDVSDERAASLLTVGRAVEQINARLGEGTAVSGWNAETARRHAEVRRQELIVLQRLMQAAPTRQASVRVVPRGRAL
ncbi:hypothetical protein ACQEU3_47065 [Spirillospora sp. CA-253888]